jgi:small multidrug resistance pump
MKLSEGFARLIPSVMVFILYFASFAFMILALKKLELGISYAIWAGVGTALIAIIGMVWFAESVTLLKIVSIAFIILGVVGLHLSQTTAG